MNETLRIALASAAGILLGLLVWIPFFSDESISLGMFLDPLNIAMAIAVFALCMLAYYRLSEWYESK